MKLKRLFAVPDQPTLTSVALLLARLLVGVAFILHGLGKIKDPFGWMGPDPFVPSLFVALAAVAEFGGGIALIVGLLTPLANLGIASTMIVATYLHAVMKGDPFVGKGGPSYELATVYLVLAVLLMATGPGRFSLDRLIFGRRGG